jgi:hypothetical protein
MEYHGGDWEYIGGKSGMSTVPVSNLSLAKLKGHLTDHISICHEDLEETSLSWRLIENDLNLKFMCSLVDDTNVNNMARHATKAADGFVEIYAIMPENATLDSSEEKRRRGT